MSSRIVSEGAKQLAAAGTLAEVAERTGLPRSTISGLRTGSLRQPSERVAGILEERLAISRDSWLEFPDAPEPEPTAARDALDDVLPSASANDVLRRARANLERLEASPSAHPRDRTAALGEYRQAVALVRKALENDGPEILDEIRVALDPFPEAREAIAEFFQRKGRKASSGEAGR